MFSTTVRSGLYLDPTGLALAKIETLAFKVETIPAFATEQVCCSITSCNYVLELRILQKQCKAYCASCTLRHFIEFINAADSTITQYESSTLQDDFFAFRVLDLLLNK